MPVTKLRIAIDGPVPAGRYFAKIAENLRVQNRHAETDLEQAERRTEVRTGRTTTPASVQTRNEGAAL